ncbi:MAG: NAD-dependent DNA ligase LigA [Bacteroidota bacterium]
MNKNPFKNTPFRDFKKVDSLSKKEAKSEIEQLREAIEHHNHKYYVENDPVVSDKKYDELFERLKSLEEEYPEFESDVSPTHKVGAPPVDSLKKKKHQSPMLSLNSSDNKTDVENFLKYIRKETDNKNAEFMLEPKFDGLSVEIVYEEGKFSYAATRGDGKTGEDVSENVKTIGSVPLKLFDEKNLPEMLSVRGEIFMDKERFQHLNKKRIEHGDKPFANARNAAAGFVRQLDSKKVADKPLDIYFYEIIDMKGMDIYTQESMFEYFKSWGLKINDQRKVCDASDCIFKFYKKLSDSRDGLPYEIDGMVIKLNDRKLQDKLGSRDRSPRWAYAYKFEPKKEVTTLVDIIVQVGRTGILTPVALLEPVEVGGVTVSRATLHNEDEIKEKDVRPGDKVRVFRAGDVIPEIKERVKKGGKKRGEAFKMPDKCPVCNASLVREGAYVLCPAGLSCTAQLKGRLSHYASQGAMDIENLGEKIISQLVDREMIKTIPELYQLEASDLEQLDGFAKKSAKKLHQAIQDAKNPEPDQFLYALGIRHVGRHIARILARKYQKLDKLVDASESELAKTKEIGPEIAESIAHFFENRDNLTMIDQLKKEGVKVKQAEGAKSDKLDGKTFVITGELDAFSRDEAKEKIESLGGRATSSVSDNTDYLVVGKGPGSKLDEAIKRNTKQLNEKEFKKMIAE